MICSGRAEYVTTFPIAVTQESLTALSLDYERPSFAIGVGLAKCEGLSLRDAKRSDRRRAGWDLRRIFEPSGSSQNWWVYELKEPKRGSYVFTADVSFQKGEKATMQCSIAASSRHHHPRRRLARRKNPSQSHYSQQFRASGAYDASYSRRRVVEADILHGVGKDAMGAWSKRVCGRRPTVVP